MYCRHFQLASALSTAYGDQAIVEVVAVSDAVKASEHDSETLVRRKRVGNSTVFLCDVVVY